MAKSKTTPKEQSPGICADCENAHSLHERTAYPPHNFFMCKCKYPSEDGKFWSHFLEKPCEIKINGKFMFHNKNN